MENYLLDRRCQISSPLAVPLQWAARTGCSAKPQAVIYNLVETAGANGLPERGYLHIVLSNLPSIDFRQHPELLRDLMSWSDYMRSCFELQQPGAVAKRKKLLQNFRFATASL